MHVFDLSAKESFDGGSEIEGHQLRADCSRGRSCSCIMLRVLCWSRPRTLRRVRPDLATVRAFLSSVETIMPLGASFRRRLSITKPFTNLLISVVRVFIEQNIVQQ